MAVWVAIVLGIVQGLTEFFPVSSSGHLALFGNWFGVKEPDLTFDVLVHLATLAAILVYFKKDWFQLFQLFFHQIRTRSFEVPTGCDLPPRIVPYLLVSMIPAGLVGVFLEEYIEFVHASNRLVGYCLLITATALLLGKRFSDERLSLKEMGWGMVITIGLAQAVAVLPGVSRSGSTIMTALFLGLRRPDGARFSFLMGAPVIAGAGILKLKDLAERAGTVTFEQWMAYGFGSLAALISGFFALKFMMKLLEGRAYFNFGYYCLAMALVAIILG